LHQGFFKWLQAPQAFMKDIDAGVNAAIITRFAVWAAPMPHVKDKLTSAEYMAAAGARLTYFILLT
jgi:hypothetical protein